MAEEAPKPDSEQSEQPELPIPSELRLELPEGWADALRHPDASLSNWEAGADHPYSLVLFFPADGGPVKVMESGGLSGWDRLLGYQARRSVRVTETGVELAAFARGGWWEERVKSLFRRRSRR